MTSGSLWSDDELALLVQQFPTSTWRELAGMLPGRTRSAVKHQAWKLRIHKTPETLKRCEVNNHGAKSWSPEDMDLLRRLWTTAPIEEVRKAFPTRSSHALEQRSRKLGVRRPAHEIKRTRDEACRLASAASKAKAAKRAADPLPVKQAIRQASRSQFALERVLSNPLEAAWRGAL